MATLPFDILGLIIDTLGSDSDPAATSTIKSLSTTCQSLLPLCRKYIFAEVAFWLNTNPTDKNARDSHAQYGADMIISTPEIANNITGLLIEYNLATTLNTNLQASICKAIKCITRLQRLRFKAGGLTYQDLTSIPSVLSALEHLFVLPTLVEIWLENLYEIPSSVVAMWRGMRRLSVLSVHNHHQVFQQSAEPCVLHTPISLRRLNYMPHNFSQMHGLFELRLPNGLPAINLSSLEILELFDYHLAYEAVPFLLNCGAHNIKQLSLGCECTSSTFKCMEEAMT